MTDLSDLHCFLGIAISRSSASLFLSQSQYAIEVLKRADMSNCNLCTTSVDTRAKLFSNDVPVAASPLLSNT